MAGGLGSRFGGDKQLVSVGPNGEVFFDYAIRSAMEVGVGAIVLVVRSDLDASVRKHLQRQHGDNFPLVIVHQDVFGPSRRKPWGTGHAVLSAASVCPGPVVVLNADDHYGSTGIQEITEALIANSGRSAVLLAFQLGQTLSDSGPVSRGVCRVADGRLVGLVETHGIRCDGSRIIADDPSGELSAGAPVSMNLWGLPVTALDRLAGQWAAFHSIYGDDPSAEFLLPEALDQQRSEGLLEISVVQTDQTWIGMTSLDDLESVRAALRQS